MKTQIIKTARRLFLKYGFFEVSMSQIAKKLQLTKPALYYYFSSKKELIEKVIENIFCDLEEILKKAKKEPTPEKKIKKFLSDYFNFIKKENPFFFKIPSKETKKYFNKQKQEFLTRVQEFFEETDQTKRKYLFLDKKFPMFVLATLNGISANMSGQKTDTKKMLQKIWQIYFKGRK